MNPLKWWMQRIEKGEDMSKRFYVSAWIWDGKEYGTEIVMESDDRQEAQEKFNEMEVSIDCPQIELWDNGEGDEDELVRLDYKET